MIESALPFAACNILYNIDYSLHTRLRSITWPLLSQAMVRVLEHFRGGQFDADILRAGAVYISGDDCV